MADDSGYSRKGFFGEVFSFLKKGVSHQIDQKLSKIIEGPIRPPGALDEVAFISTCTRCHECSHACPYQAIQKMPLESGVAANTPFIDPATQACHLCPDTPCITACPSGALAPTAIENVRMGRAVIDEERCITYQDKVCTLCFDACPLPEIAITIDEAFHPQITNRCTGCGMCQKRCPEMPSAVNVLSPFQFSRKKAEDETYFGFFPKADLESEEE